MSATAITCALGWLDVASACIERAAACAAVGECEAEERYQRMRTRLDEQISEARYDLRIANIILERLERERVAAGEVAA